MWNKTKSLFLSRILTVAVTAVFVMLIFFVPYIADFYDMIGEPIGLIKGSVRIPMCIGMYAADALALWALWHLNKLLSNINKEKVFVEENTACLRRISWACIFAALIFIFIGLWRSVFFMPALFAGMLGLIMRVLKNVFEKAVEIKSENDFTI